MGAFVLFERVIDALNACYAIAPLASNQLCTSLDEHLLLLAFSKQIHLLARLDDLLSALAGLGQDVSLVLIPSIIVTHWLDSCCQGLQQGLLFDSDIVKSVKFLCEATL